MLTQKKLARQPKKILIVDDELSIRRILEKRFQLFGFQTATAANGHDAWSVFQQFSPDIVILDLMLPQIDGHTVLNKIRQVSDTPVVIVTAMNAVEERITGLEAGADDYLVKPFHPKELEARVNSILRRTLPSQMKPKNGPVQAQASQILQFDTLRLNLSKRQAFRDGERLRLTEMEFTLLECLASRPGEPMPRKEILKALWGQESQQQFIETRIVDVHIGRLRGKLEKDIATPEFILTVRGVGYMFPKIKGLKTTG